MPYPEHATTQQGGLADVYASHSPPTLRIFRVCGSIIDTFLGPVVGSNRFALKINIKDYFLMFFHWRFVTFKFSAPHGTELRGPMGHKMGRLGPNGPY